MKVDDFMGILEEAVTFNELKWDTDFFGVSSAKAVLHRSLTLEEWNELKSKFDGFQFISITNKSSDPANAQFIGKNLSSFLIDVNIQFEKGIIEPLELPKNISIHEALKVDNRIIEITDFQFSKFIDDPKLARRGGHRVYHQWLYNSFEKKGKYFALSKDNKNGINGYILFSYVNNSCLIELIAVSKEIIKSGIGTSLFKSVEHFAYHQGYNKITVGTQARNTGAINFYHKVGCKQVDSHQIYHLWNK